MRNAFSEAMVQAVMGQVAVLQMHAARHRFVRGGAAVPWAYAVARRLLIDLGRRVAREVLRAGGARDSEEAATPPSPEEALHHRRLEAEAGPELATLPSGWREAFELVKFEGLSVAEAAEELGITPGMVQLGTRRATTALREAEARRRDGSSGQSGRPAPRLSPAGDVSEGGMPT